jgi:hypothetical protein
MRAGFDPSHPDRIQALFDVVEPCQRADVDIDTVGLVFRVD